MSEYNGPTREQMEDQRARMEIVETMRDWYNRGGVFREHVMRHHPEIKDLMGIKE